jgi:hypothetical protein
MKMKKKAKSRAETLLFVFCISFAVFILLFIIIATVVSLMKDFRRGKPLFSLTGTAPEKAPKPEEWPVQPRNLHSEGTAAIKGTRGEAKPLHTQEELH